MPTGISARQRNSWENLSTWFLRGDSMDCTAFCLIYRSKLYLFSHINYAGWPFNIFNEWWLSNRFIHKSNRFLLSIDIGESQSTECRSIYGYGMLTCLFGLYRVYIWFLTWDFFQIPCLSWKRWVLNSITKIIRRECYMKVIKITK